MKTKEISGYKINLLEKWQQITIDISFPGLLIEFTEKEYEILLPQLTEGSFFREIR